MKNEFLKEQFIGKNWSFGIDGEEPLTKTLEFLEEGSVVGIEESSISKWDFRKNVLYLLDDDSTTVYRFTVKTDEFDRMPLYSDSLLFSKEKEKAILYLSETDFSYTYEYVVKLELYLKNLKFAKEAQEQLENFNFNFNKFVKDTLVWLSKSYSEDKKTVALNEILPEYKPRINQLISELLMEIDDILIEKFVPYWLRHHFWEIKHGKAHVKPGELAPRFWFGYFVSPTEYLSGSISITETHEHNGVLTIRGFYTKPSYEGIELVCVSSSETQVVESLYSEAVNKKYFLDEEIMPAMTFNVSIPCIYNENDTESLIFYFRYEGNLYPTTITHTATSRLFHKRKLFVGDQYIYSTTSKYAINYKPLNIKNVTTDVVKNSNNFIMIKFFENLMQNASRRVWVFIDTPKTIDDNAEVLFRYVSQFDDGIEKYLIIPDESYKELFDLDLHEYLIVYGTWEQQLLFLIAEKLISSNSLNLNLVFPSIFKKFRRLTLDQKTNYFALSNADFVFLSHGYTIGDSSTFINKYTADMQLVSIASDVELKNMENGKYQYENIKVTGLPRYDRYRLDGHSEKIIVFMPTFDKKYVHADRRYDSNYIGGKHWSMITELLNNTELMSVLKDKGYTFLFKPHPFLEPQMRDFTFKDPVVLADESWDYKRIVNEGAIAITDYSTAVFDFAYLKKPLLYLHNLKNIKFKYEETWNYEDHGFGEICDSIDSLVNEIITLIENDCQMDDKYKKRVDDFFTIQDRNNSKRVYEELLKLPLHKRKLFDNFNINTVSYDTQKAISHTNNE